METQDFIQPDVYGESEREISRNDSYRSYEDQVRPQTYYERNSLLYQFTRIVVMLFPFISGGTMFALALLINMDIKEVLKYGLQLDEWIIFVLSFIGFLIAIILNELIKTKSLGQLFKASARKDLIPRQLFAGAIITTIVSIAGSAWGIYLTNYTIKDNSVDIEEFAEQEMVQAEAAWKADSTRIVSSYDSQIEAKRQSISQFNPTRYRTKVDQLNNDITNLVNQREQELKNAKAGLSSSIKDISIQTGLKLSSNKNEATDYALIGLTVLVVLELCNIVCHRFNWIFRVRCTVENSMHSEGYDLQRAEAHYRRQESRKKRRAGKRKKVGQELGGERIKHENGYAETPQASTRIRGFESMTSWNFEDEMSRPDNEASSSGGEGHNDISSADPRELITDHVYRLQKLPIRTEITCALPGCFNRFERKNYKHVYCCKQHRQQAHAILKGELKREKA